MSDPTKDPFYGARVLGATPQAPKLSAAQRAHRANAIALTEAIMSGTNVGAKYTTAEEVEAADAAEEQTKKDKAQASLEAALKAEIDRSIGS